MTSYFLSATMVVFCSGSGFIYHDLSTGKMEYMSHKYIIHDVKEDAYYLSSNKVDLRFDDELELAKECGQNTDESNLEGELDE